MCLGNFASTLIISPNPFIRCTVADDFMKILSETVLIGCEKFKARLEFVICINRTLLPILNFLWSTWWTEDNFFRKSRYLLLLHPLSSLIKDYHWSTFQFHTTYGSWDFRGGCTLWMCALYIVKEKGLYLHR